MEFLKKEQVSGIVKEITPAQILFASTSQPDYSMSRCFLIQIDYGDYIVLEGGHCSCYDFDEVEWSGTSYTGEELKKLASSTWLNDYADTKELAIFVQRYIGK